MANGTPRAAAWRNAAFTCTAGTDTITRSGVVGNDATEIVFEYRPQVGFSEGPLGQQDWSQDRMKVDGQEADLVSYAATDAFAGGRTLRMRVRRPEAQTHQSVPTPERGMELGATANCRTDADCDVARRVFSLIDLSDRRD